MTKQELIEKLKVIKEKIEEKGDVEEGHYEADNLLIEYINDKEIERAYNEIDKWYA